ncbi:MAG: hypothetical protein E6G92_11000 [Alphaproteobacteria bacterium]|nr:MAG: hypothetical protein E6G92_11000 [Alphaproteobacteria bacterium]
MRPTRSFILPAAAFASLALAGGAAQAQRAYPNVATPRVSGTPMPMDPAWAFAFDPLLEDPMWSSLDADPVLGMPTMPADPREAARVADSMRRRMTELRRMGAPGAPFTGDPAWGELSIDSGAPGFAGVGGPGAGAAAGSATAYSYSSHTDETGCTRSTETAQTWPGPAPSVVTRAEGCAGAPAGPARPEPDGDEPEGGN